MDDEIPKATDSVIGAGARAAEALSRVTARSPIVSPTTLPATTAAQPTSFDQPFNRIESRTREIHTAPASNTPFENQRHYPRRSGMFNSIMPVVGDSTPSNVWHNAYIEGHPGDEISGEFVSPINPVDLTGAGSTADGTTWSVSTGSRGFKIKTYRQYKENDGSVIKVVGGTAVSDTNVFPFSGATVQVASHAGSLSDTIPLMANTGNIVDAQLNLTGIAANVPVYSGFAAAVTAVAPPGVATATANFVSYAGAGSIHVGDYGGVLRAAEVVSGTTLYDVLFDTGADLVPDANGVSAVAVAQITGSSITQLQPIKITIFSRIWIFNAWGICTSVSGETQVTQYTIYQKV